MGSNPTTSTNEKIVPVVLNYLDSKIRLIILASKVDKELTMANENELKMSELCDALCVTRPTVYSYMKRGMPYRRTWDGLKYRNSFDLKVVRSWINEQQKRRGK